MGAMINSIDLDGNTKGKVSIDIIGNGGPTEDEEGKPVRNPRVFVNPEIYDPSEELSVYNEGCLSIPGISCEIERPDHVVVEAYDLDANLIRYEATGDLFCVCLQHEIDHLHGNTMFERLKPMQRIKAVKEYQDALARGARPGETE